jgi:CDP-diacylglycerol--serine O-phosphatidyltransferase
MNLFQSIKRQIPNCITLCNLLCGVLATYFAIQYQNYNYQLHYAAWFILLGIFFDFFDGMAARLLHVASDIGKELDSLADVITSGVAPGFILYGILSTSDGLPWLKYISLFMPAFAAYRLAKFNLDTRQSHSFLGLPAPSNALIWVGLAFLFSCAPVEKVDWLFNNSGLICLALLSLITNLLMVSEMPMFSLKFNFKDLSWKSNKVQYTFLSGCLLLILFMLQYSISLIILWYILLSLLTQKKHPANE